MLDKSDMRRRIYTTKVVWCAEVPPCTFGENNLMKTLLQTAAALALSASCFAQPLLQTSGLTIGQQFEIFQLANVNAATMLTSGANVIWDISTASTTAIGTMQFESMTGNPHAATYPDANFAMKQTVGTQVSYSLSKHTANKSETVATAVGTPNETSYPNYRTELPDPYTFTTIDVDTYQKAGQAAKIVTHHYDAYGTLITNGATYNNVVRETITDNGNVSYLWWNSSPVFPILHQGSNFTLYRPLPNALIEINAKEEITVYPNPAKDQITIRSKKPVERIEIYDAAGRLIMQHASLVISLRGLSSGIYCIKAYNAGRVAVKRFVKN